MFCPQRILAAGIEPLKLYKADRTLVEVNEIPLAKLLLLDLGLVRSSLGIYRFYPRYTPPLLTIADTSGGHRTLKALLGGSNLRDVLWAGR